MLQFFGKNHLEGPDMLTTGQKSMRIRAAGVACLTVLAGTMLCQAAKQAGPTGVNPQSANVNPWLDRSLKILYAGRPGSDREKDFVAFLKKYFDVVRTGNLETFKEGDTQGFDVTLLDGDFGVFEGPCPAPSESFSRPVITLGVHGSMMCSRWRLKTTYL
jgi:hypothetical protein